MKKVSKYLFLVTLLFLSSCAALKPGYRNITSYSERMELLRYGFPEIYDMYRAGRINITQMYVYRDNYGEERVKVKYIYL